MKMEECHTFFHGVFGFGFASVSIKCSPVLILRQNISIEIRCSLMQCYDIVKCFHIRNTGMGLEFP